MVLASHRIDCPRCGAPLEVRSARSKSVACAHCHALVDLTSEAHAFLGELRAEPIVHPLRVGLRGTLKGLSCTIIGHVRYREDAWFWDEYLVMSDEGFVAWIGYDDGEFRLFVPFVPARPEPVSSASTVLVADGRRDPIRERGVATLDRIEGELTWRARVGDVVHYLEGRLLCVEIGATEMEWFTIEALPRGAVANAFGLDYAALSRGCYALDDEGRVRLGAPAFAAAPAPAKRVPFLVVLLVLFLCMISCCCLLPGGESGGSYGGGHYQSSGWSGGK